MRRTGRAGIANEARRRRRGRRARRRRPPSQSSFCDQVTKLGTRRVGKKTSIDRSRVGGLVDALFCWQLHRGVPAGWVRAWPSAVRRVAPPLAGRGSAGQRHGLRSVECLPARPGIGQV
eukprot:scaffold69173_cov57-Phaeocystis_antarctica.AAC.3